MLAHDYIAIAQGREVTPEKYRDFPKLSNSPSSTNNAAVLKGTDVDQPRNLAKSVTVE
ncbi:hypothetical protein OKW11_002951 [Pseudomonas baetica]|nr:hypothetical protein [Pseudomonas baetica]MDF9775994.1 hypothetical protein [Pseudomonas baetica]